MNIFNNSIKFLWILRYLSIAFLKFATHTSSYIKIREFARALAKTTDLCQFQYPYTRWRYQLPVSLWEVFLQLGSVSKIFDLGRVFRNWGVYFNIGECILILGSVFLFGECFLTLACFWTLACVFSNWGVFVHMSHRNNMI